VTTLRQIRVHREGQFIDRFSKAIEQLSSDQIGTRMSGVYAMEQLAEVAPHYRGHIAALLASFVRQHAPWPPSRPLQDVDLERQRYPRRASRRCRRRDGCPQPARDDPARHGNRTGKSTCALPIWPGRT
jgi:hypothetical protein